MNTIPVKRKKIKNISKKRINEIERLKGEGKNYENKLLDCEIKIIKLLTDVEYKKHSVLDYIAVLESKF